MHKFQNSTKELTQVIASSVTKGSVESSTNLPHKVCTLRKKMQMLPIKCDSFFLHKQPPEGGTPRENSFQARIFFHPPPLARPHLSGNILCSNFRTEENICDECMALTFSDSNLKLVHLSISWR